MRSIHWHDPIHLSPRIAVIDALDAKGNPRLAEIRKASYTTGRAKGRIEGRAKGRIEAIEAACELLDILLGPLERTQLAALDDAGLATLLARIKAERRWP